MPGEDLVELLVQREDLDLGFQVDLLSAKARLTSRLIWARLATPVITRRSRSDSLWKPVSRSCSASWRTWSSMPAFAPRKRGGHQALPPFPVRSLNTALTAGPEVETAALLDFSAVVFLGFFASRFDFLWPLAMATSLACQVRM
jgi:hypothetical protein